MIRFHTSGIDYLIVVYKNLKTLFDKTNETHIIHIVKQLIYLDRLSFEQTEDDLAHLKGVQLKLGECKKDFPKNMVNSLN